MSYVGFIEVIHLFEYKLPDYVVQIYPLLTGSYGVIFIAVSEAVCLGLVLSY